MHAIARRVIAMTAGTLLVGSAGGLLAPAAQADPGAGTRMVPTTWLCSNGDTATFNLPPVAISPGQGAITAPFPGFLTAISGPVPMPLGTYVVLAAASAPTGPFHYFGQKVGVANGLTATCTLQGTPATVIVGAAGD